MASHFINDALIATARREDVLIVHPHCQRTAGGTFRNRVLVPTFGKEQVYARMFVPNAKRWSRLREADLAHYRAYTDLHNYTDIGLKRPHVAVALARDPVYRAISLYNFVRRTDGHVLQALAKQYALEDFYWRASSMRPSYFRNVQCRRICGFGDARRALRFISERYIGVGFTNQVPEFVHALSDVFGWPQIELPHRGNDEDRYGAEATPRFRAMVLATNREDRELFEILSAGPPFSTKPRHFARQVQNWMTEGRDLALTALRRMTG